MAITFSTTQIFKLLLFKKSNRKRKITKDHQKQDDTHAIMKNFYKKAGIADLIIFGALGACFFVYLIYPHFGWWNFMLLLIGLGAGMVMGRLFHFRWQTKKRIEEEKQESEAFYQKEERFITETSGEIIEDRNPPVPKPIKNEPQTLRAKLIEAFLTD